jgi:hypothetical protein
MEPKLKAKEIVDKYWSIGEQEWQDTPLTWEEAKQCALIAVDEILKNNLILFEDVLNNQYWKEVKQEIEKL